MKQFLLLCSFLTLTTFSLFAQPANDACTDAIAIAIGEVVDFTTIDATTDGVKHPTCLGTNDSILLDVWYTYTATSDAVLRWSNCGTADFDSRIAVYNAATACDASDDNLVACNDDGPAACSAAFFTSELLFAVTAGQNYVLRMGGYAGDDGIAAFGSGTVVLTEVANVPSNTFCANSIPLELGAGQAFSTLNALTDGPDHAGSPCFGFGSITAVSDIWYTYTPDFTGFVEWTTCNMADFDTRLAVYNPGSACPPLSEDLYACNDDGGGCSGFSSEMIFGVIAGETYLLRLGGFSGSGTGTFDLLMVTPPDPPVNDDCADAIPVELITVDQADELTFLTTGTTISGTFVSENYQFPVCLENQDGGEFADVWYSFETLGNTEIGLQLLPTGEGEVPATSFYLDIFASCDARVDTSVIMNSCILTDEVNSFAIETMTGLPEGENITLYVRVTTRLTSDIPGGFAFQLVGEIVNDVKELTVAEDLKLFPNPVEGQAMVQFSLSEATVMTASVTDLLGHRVQEHQLGTLSGGTQQFELDTQNLPAGIYLLQLNSGKAQQSIRFVVK
jgi:hypothetical protein